MMKNQKKTNWQRLKEKPQQMARYKTWRRQYLSRRQKKSKSVADVKLSRKGVIYKITDFLLAVDLQDHEIIAVWKGLKAITRAVYGEGVAGGAV